ncbi:MAG: hypothetical protein KJ077_10500 [Anaerolineae bacterium]|nr:hypothetical protein [Anaerolineae bacterium]
MASRELKVQQITIAGLVPILEAAHTGGNYFQGGLTTFLVVQNDGLSSRTITIPYRQEVAGQTVTPLTRTVAAGERVYIGPFVEGYRGDNNEVQVTYSDATDVIVAAIMVYPGDFYA